MYECITIFFKAIIGPTCIKKQFLTSVIIDLSTKSAEIIIMTAFLAHIIKDISRGQLLSALNSLNKTSGEFRSADKGELVRPLAMSLIESNVVEVVPWAKLNNLTLVDCKKKALFKLFVSLCLLFHCV